MCLKSIIDEILTVLEQHCSNWSRELVTRLYGKICLQWISAHTLVSSSQHFPHIKMNNPHQWMHDDIESCCKKWVVFSEPRLHFTGLTLQFNLSLQRYYSWDVHNCILESGGEYVVQSIHFLPIPNSQPMTFFFTELQLREENTPRLLSKLGVFGR